MFDADDFDANDFETEAETPPPGEEPALVWPVTTTTRGTRVIV
jgi:hypothetical protein